MSAFTNKAAVITAVALAALVAVALTAARTAGTRSRMRQEQNSKAAVEGATAAEQVLPGSAAPLLEVGLYPRVTGYIKTRLVDIGDRVQKGQVLAVIDAPDLDDQLANARANLTLARANLEKAKANAELSEKVENCYQAWLSAGHVSPMEYQIKVKTHGTDKAAVGAMEAAIKVHEAAVQRFTDLQAFKKIVAPFPGVITARGIDPGDLVTADSTARELFHLMRTDILRVFVDVPQVNARDIQVGQRAVVYRREDPLKPFSGQVTRTADALDPDTRTLRTEVQVANPDYALRPGMDLQVKFIFRNEQQGTLIPGDDLPEGTVADPVRQQPVSRGTCPGLSSR
jgi:RND family efflux transporter MFP subunit